MTFTDQDKVRRLKEQLGKIRSESSNIKRQLREEQRKLLFSNIKNSRQNVSQLLDIHISVRSLLLSIVFIAFIIGLIFFVKYLSSLSPNIQSSTDAINLSDIQESINESQSLTENQQDKQQNNLSITINGSDTAITDVEINDDVEAEESTQESTSTSSIDGQSLITDYKNVKIEFRGEGISVEDKGTYGRVIKIFYKITNNEDGKINLKTITYQYESDLPLALTLPTSLQVLGSKQYIESVIDPKDLDKKRTNLGTFTKDAKKISYKLTLKDDKGKTVATTTKEFNVN